MEINLPGIVNAAFPNRAKNKNVAILSQNDGGSGSGSSSGSSGSSTTTWTTSSSGGGSGNPNDPGFLSDEFHQSFFNNGGKGGGGGGGGGGPRLYVTAESDDFDAETLAAWRGEGFRVAYVPLGKGGDAYKARLEGLGRGVEPGEEPGADADGENKKGGGDPFGKLGPCETYGIVAFGDAAAACLEHFHVLDNNPEHRLGCLVAYYPSAVPDPRARFPAAISVLVHLAGDEVDVVTHSQMVGIQGKRRVARRKIERGLGTGGSVSSAKTAYRSYTYAGAEPGFAEHDLDEYDHVSAGLAWSRSLGVVRRAFRRDRDADLEALVEQNAEHKFNTRNLAGTMATYTTHAPPPHATHLPTLTGGIGAAELRRFYAECFLASNPPSLRLTLLSRTVGADRVVDELHVAFKHTHEMPWILPGVPPTNRRVEVMVVSIVTVRGGRLCSEHVYWDQASVLLQVGLLDAKAGVAAGAREKLGVRRLPVVGRAAARRVRRGGFEDGEDVEVEGEGEADNELIPGWYSDEDGDGDGEKEEKNKKTTPPPQKETGKEKPAAGSDNSKKVEKTAEEEEPRKPGQQQAGTQGSGAPARDETEVEEPQQQQQQKPEPDQEPRSAGQQEQQQEPGTQSQNELRDQESEPAQQQEEQQQQQEEPVQQAGGEVRQSEDGPR
ncbi:hypothetical protein GGR56DRAFT_684571 [Xylariaceae sp. FL0804]|nr:hypothetical protein GGR56DRAFT_684571 [Xylariaceae sp. FL0804]